MIKIGVNGACGKMGKRIINLAKTNNGLEVIFGLEDQNSPCVGKDIEGIKISSDLGLIASCDCLIDFSVPVATSKCLDYALKLKKNLVIGTTGLDDAIQAKIKAASSSIGVVYSPNMSVGVNLLFKLIKSASGILNNYRVYIQEAHHVHKKDSPSGTAKRIVQIINEGGFDVKDKDVKAIRENEIVGDHKIIFESDVDKIELSHSAKTRDIFAKGAILAAKWVVDKPAGLYSMADVLSLKEA